MAVTFRIVVLALAALALLSTPAGAGTLELTTQITPASKSYPQEQRSQFAHYRAAPGEVNDIVGARVAPDGLLTFSDTAGVTPGRGCTAVTAQVVQCPIAHSFHGISAALGDGDDRFVDSAGATIQGGAGDDILDGGTVEGGPGDDVLSGSAAEGGPGADRIDAGTVSYRQATGPVRVDLRHPARAGQAGEGDQLSAAVVDVVGGRFDDVLIGDARANELNGAGGDDRVLAGAGEDTPAGGDGDDLVHGGAGNDYPHGDNGDDRILGGPGNDRAYGGFGRDTLNGGPGRDLLVGDEGADRLDGGRGSDSLDGVRGADVLLSRDGTIDALTCSASIRLGRGSVARTDMRDIVRGCGHVVRPAPGQAVLVSARQHGAAVRVEIGCSQDLPRGCRGTLRLFVGGRSVSRAAIRLGPGRGQGYPLAMPIDQFESATRGCATLRAEVRFSSRNASGARFTARRTVTVTADDAACGRSPRPLPDVSVATW